MILNIPKKVATLDTKSLIANLSENEQLELFQEILLSLSFLGAIGEIRELVNDPKWDDKV